MNDVCVCDFFFQSTIMNKLICMENFLFLMAYFIDAVLLYFTCYLGAVVVDDVDDDEICWC